MWLLLPFSILILAVALVGAACGDDSNTGEQVSGTVTAEPDPEPDPEADPEPEPDPELEVNLEDADLVIYSGREPELIGPIIERFEEASGVDVGVKYGSNSELIATIFEEGSNSPADIFYGSDPGALGALSERFVELPDEILERVDPPFRSREGKWVGVSGRARVVVYNTNAVSESDLPDSIFDFTDPKWEGRIGWAPTNGSFQAMVTAMRVMEGDERTREWLEGILANDPLVFESNTPIVEAVGNGEVDVGFVNHYYLHRILAERGESFPARNYHLPGGDPGAVVLVAGGGILGTADDVEAAEAFFDFLLSEEAQNYFSDETFEYPLIDGVEPEAGLPPLEEIDVPDVDLSQLADLEATLALLRETGALP
jgi:iron(III) transport system substrate-binding protein